MERSIHVPVTYRANFLKRLGLLIICCLIFPVLVVIAHPATATRMDPRGYITLPAFAAYWCGPFYFFSFGPLWLPKGIWQVVIMELAGYGIMWEIWTIDPSRISLYVIVGIAIVSGVVAWFLFKWLQRLGYREVYLEGQFPEAPVDSVVYEKTLFYKVRIEGRKLNSCVFSDCAFQECTFDSFEVGRLALVGCKLDRSSRSDLPDELRLEPGREIFAPELKRYAYTWKHGYVLNADTASGRVDYILSRFFPLL